MQARVVSDVLNLDSYIVIAITLTLVHQKRHMQFWRQLQISEGVGWVSWPHWPGLPEPLFMIMIMIMIIIFLW